MKKKYIVIREGFLMNVWKSKDDVVLLHPRQARYLITAEQIREDVPDAPAPASAPDAAPAPAADTEAK